MRQDLNTTGDGKLVSIQHYDQLGGTRLSRQLEDASTQNAYDETSGIKVQSRFQYSGTNSYTLVSNPYRAASSATAGAESTMGWSRAKLDNGGRVAEEQTYSGAGLPSPWGTNVSGTGAVTMLYDRDRTTVTDQAGKIRRSVIDGLGRLTQVVEEPSGLNYKTNYGYDALNDLTSVTQGTQPARSFVYDSLKRLTSAFNPESGTVNYTYDSNGNLQTKTDARSVVTTYAYDGLNRVTTRTYSGPAPGGTTPGVTYGYDNAAVANSKGWLTSVSSSVSSYSYGSYDVMGRVLTGTQTTGGQPYTMSYQYNLVGGMTSETYPSNKIVVTEYDSAGRIAGVKKDPTTYYAGGTPATANAMSYAAHGGVSTMRLGNGKWEHTFYNSRLQPEEIGLGTSSADSSTLRLDYTYGTTTNNGNVQTQRIVIAGSLDVTQSYTYDELNRLKTANESSGTNWSQTYDYDRWGNRAVRVGSYIPQPQLTPQSSSPTDFSAFNQSNNRIALGGFGYDPAGNLTSDPTTAANAMLYDGENRQISYTKAGVTTTYAYDGDGHRVKKIDSTGTTVFVYNAGGQLIAEYTSGPPTGSGTSYLTSDHLGSTRAVTDGGGAVKARYDYLPFGEELNASIGGRTVGMGYSAADSTKQKFTQKERDSESGLDYFLARYYSSAQGRFTSPDPIPITPERQLNPQSINLYVYVANNPLAYLDPTGMELVRLGQHTDEEIKKRQAEIDAGLKKEGITDQQKEALEKERNTLQLEQEGNRVVRELLAKLDAAGERQGLQLGDFTLSTDPRNDFRSLTQQRGFRGRALERELGETATAAATVFRGQSRQIFINQTSVLYQGVLNDGGYLHGTERANARDTGTMLATYIPHEKYHRDVGPSERRAYQEQLRVLNKFGPGPFVNQNVFTLFKQDLTRASRTGTMPR